MQMNRFFRAVISAALVVGIVGTGAAGFRAAASAGTTVQRGRAAAAVRFAPRLIRQADKKLRYAVKARYPQAIGAARDPRLAKLNEALRSLMTKEVAAFTNDFQAPEEVMSTVGSYFDASYTVSLATPNLVSVYFSINTYFEGAAHPNNNSLVFNYDLSAGKTLDLGDLFKKNSNYLKVISSYAIKDLTRQLGPDPDTDWIRKGAGAESENYANWNVSRKGLEITFDQYQVASYAEGPHEVVIPHALLKDLIDPNGPLAKIR